MLWLSRRLSRGFVPSPAVEDAAVTFLENPAPLLEVERHTGSLALVTDVYGPLFLHLTSARARLPPDDDPIDACQVQIGQWAEQGFQW